MGDFPRGDSVFSAGKIRRSIERPGQGPNTPLSVLPTAILTSTAALGSQYIFFGGLGQNRSNSLKNAPTGRQKNTFS